MWAALMTLWSPISICSKYAISHPASSILEIGQTHCILKENGPGLSPIPDNTPTLLPIHACPKLSHCNVRSRERGWSASAPPWPSHRSAKHRNQNSGKIADKCNKKTPRKAVETVLFCFKEKHFRIVFTSFASILCCSRIEH